MCGLVGVAGNIGQKEEAVFKRLLEIDTIRGPHSTGILAVSSTGNTEVFKKVGTPWDLYQYKQFDELMRSKLNVLMGHNRYATKGKINSINAHPFEHGHITGAHNGTLRNQSLLLDYKEFDVDSDNIFYSISCVGVDETVKKLAGAFALTWYNEEENTMNFIRNDERPLFLAESEDKRTVFWASELWMLEVTLKLADIKFRQPFQPRPGELFSYPIEMSYSPKAFKDVYVRDLQLHRYEVQNPPKSNSTATSTAGKTDAAKNLEVFNKAKEAESKKTQGGSKVTAQDLLMQGVVEFCVSSIKTSEYTHQQWISCLPLIDDCEVELRLYTTSTDLTKLMMESVHSFKGTVRGYSTVGGDAYCTLDPRTIEEIIPDDSDEEEEEFAVTYGGEILSEDEYDLAVSCGCGNCRTIPTLEESVELIWLDRMNFICGECKDLPIVQDFINKASNPSLTTH